MFAAADFETRSLAAKYEKRPPHGSKTRRWSARQTRQLEPLKGRTARVPARLRLRAQRSAPRCYAPVSPAPRPGPTQEAQPSEDCRKPRSGAGVRGARGSPPPALPRRPKERPRLPGEGRSKDAPGRWPCPRGGANRCPAHPAAVAHTWKSPPGQVCAPPGAGPERGVGGARTGRRGERRRAGAGLARGVGGLDFTAGRSGPLLEFFYLLWCCSHRPVLIGQPGKSAVA